jgi:hypothetical protein
MKLQQVGLERFDARRKLIVAGIDGQRNLLRPPRTRAPSARAISRST